MQITSDIRRSDLFHLNLYVYPRARGTYIFVGAIMLGVLVMGPMIHGDFTLKALALGVLFGVLAGIGGVVLLFLLCVTIQVLTQSKNTGVLGARTYTLRDDGFEWDGETSSGKQKWTAIRSVIKTKDYVLISLTPGLFFVVPGRSFTSREAFNAFFDEAFSLWKKSNP
jgi:hypothetical protein